MTKDEVVAAVKALGSQQEIAACRDKLGKRQTLLLRISYGALALGFPGFFYVMSPSATHLPFYGLYVALEFSVLFGFGIFLGMFASMYMPNPEGFTLLSELNKTREALELVEKSEQARMVRDAVLEQGRSLVGRDFYLMRNLWRSEDAAKTAEVRKVEEAALSLKLHAQPPSH